MTETDEVVLAAHGIAAGYEGRRVLDGLTAGIDKGSITALVGPNASGKSTLLRALARVLPVSGGTVLLNGADIHRLPTRQVAREMGLLPQSPIAPEGVVVADLVWRGRHPHQRLGRRRSEEDDLAIAEALLATGTDDLAERPVDELSGGQRQRVWIAMALAQRTPVLLLDEPTTYLDIAHQIDVLDLLLDLNRTAGKTIVLVSHDLNHAARYADRLIALRDGRIVANGPPAEVLDESLVERVFGLRCRVLPDPVHGAPHVFPVGRHDDALSSPLTKQKENR
ncbi:ABC transporter ATP-binding protein [Amycolatopsis umgeniensis]|uniref:Iron complex transport system ATP-binding protein n=1 Tax=Amycolatopsis umgeniensis TaxID=336628 RepID=A0A841AVX5_9PSEU|nr:ABC transporter ATP-binding protein [Amycolatopsis umgeniensis]MBB5850512.1 iron complex transport system ATP-binding protein [Amycolatopsis umgeniensis]